MNTGTKLVAMVTLQLAVLCSAAVAARGEGARAQRQSGSGEPARLRLELIPTMMAGESGGKQGDLAELRIDPNTATSRFAGVGSLAVAFPQRRVICSGTAISRRHVLTAAHCVFDFQSGVLATPEAVTFVLNAGGNLTSRIAGAAVDVLPELLLKRSSRFDMAVVTLQEEIPEGVPVYEILRQPLPLRTTITMVGYGLSGDGHTGIEFEYSNAVWSTKRSGQNVVDFIGQPGAGNENHFFYDFDGPQAAGLNILGGTTLGNRTESCAAFGDSGGPAFVEDSSGALLIAGLNNFVVMFRSASQGSPQQPRWSTFGEGGGGLTVPPHAAWIDSITGGTPVAATPLFTLDASDDSSAIIQELEEVDYELYEIFDPDTRRR